MIKGTNQLAHCLGLDARQFERFAAVENLYMRRKNPACTASAEPSLVIGSLRTADGTDPDAAMTPGAVSLS
ncbi:hypothetical protein H9P43_000153 [Blastocladiella emersonii ATCC 22665]|nr:hypothetical protein H9P43_000153 [Blastocladiella emersonii ATCC 22665]